MRAMVDSLVVKGVRRIHDLRASGLLGPPLRSRVRLRCAFTRGQCYRGRIGVNSLSPWWKPRSGPDGIAVPAMQQIADWLKKLGMPEYSERFVEKQDRYFRSS